MLDKCIIRDHILITEKLVTLPINETLKKVYWDASSLLYIERMPPLYRQKAIENYLEWKTQIQKRIYFQMLLNMF